MAAATWQLDADAMWDSPFQTAGTVVLAWTVAVTMWRLLTEKLPPSAHPLACLPIPVVGGILNLFVFLSEFSKLDKEKPWDATIQTKNKLGRTFRLPFLLDTAYTIVGPEGLKIGLTCKTEDGERVLGIQKMPGILNIWGKNALSSTEIGEPRSRLKKIMHPTLAPKALQAYFVGMSKDIDDWMTVNFSQLPADGIVRVYQPIRELTMVVPIRSVLGLGSDADSIVNKTRHLLIAMWDGTFAPPVAALGGDYAKGVAAREKLVPIIREMIQKRRKEQEEQQTCGIDMLSQLVRASDEQGKLTEGEIIDQVVVIFLAGYETSVSLIITALHYLALPEYAPVLAKLRAEQETFPGAVTYGDLQAMPYMHNFFYECLRVVPPVPQFARTVTKSFEFDGYTIPKGSTFFYQIAASQRNSVEDPDKLIPERHDDKTSPLNQPYGFTPFAGSDFLCPGKGFVLLEAALMVRRIVTEFDFKHATANPALKFDPLFLRPVDDQPLCFTRREDPQAADDD